MYCIFVSTTGSITLSICIRCLDSNPASSVALQLAPYDVILLASHVVKLIGIFTIALLAIWLIVDSTHSLATAPNNLVISPLLVQALLWIRSLYP